MHRLGTVCIKPLTLCPLGYFPTFFIVCWYFSESFFFKFFFLGFDQSVNCLDPYQARHYVGPDLGLNCLR